MAVVRLFRRWLRTAPRVFTFSIILLLPFGYAPQEPDSALFEIGVHGGYGQIASILRDCEGNPTSVQTNTFSDVSGAVFFQHPSNSRIKVVYGIRAGYWRSTARFAGYPRDLGDHVEFFYINPSISLEGTRVGFGLGISFGKVPYSFNNLDEEEPYSERLISTHLRLGRVDEAHFVSAFNESEPLVSGGGLWTLGMGYRAGRRTMMFTGMSMLPYDPYDIGLIHQMRFRLGPSLAGDLAFRGGFAAKQFEGGLSAGLVWRVGR